ncbi:hypothetical protein ACPZMI_13115 [Pseudomonas wayambapalatensis]|uniref:hypothetical protein n=1 Tax=Pseudomonas wayambapalatensis TaxID=485895 RepID=UPI003CF014F7
MDKLLEYCKARYDEELGFKFSLANIFAWLFFVVSIFISSNNLSDVVFCGLSQIKVKNMLDMSDGVIPSLTMLQLLYSVGFVIATAWLCRSMSEGLFYLFTLKEEFKTLVIDITLKFHDVKGNDVQRKALGLGAKVEIDRNIKKIRRTTSLAEVFLVIALCTAILMPLSMINIIVFAVCGLTFLVIVWSSFHYFVSDVLPYHVAIKYSAGELAEIRQSYTASLH